MYKDWAVHYTRFAEMGVAIQHCGISRALARVRVRVRVIDVVALSSEFECSSQPLELNMSIT